VYKALWMAAACGAVLGLSQSARAQRVPYDPYAPVVEDPRPVKEDGSLNWPTLFRSQQLQNKFQSYASLGSCTGTRKDVNNRLRDNRVDVNTLPEAEFRGRVMGLLPGVVTLKDSDGKDVIVVTHPAGVSQVQVSGPMQVQALRPGMIVQFVSAVDEHGLGTRPVEALEVIVPDEKSQPTIVEPGREQTMVGTIHRLNGHQLIVRLDRGKLKRLTLTLADQIAVSASGKSLSLAAAGDEVVAKGHAYSGEGFGGKQVVFAGSVTVTKGVPGAESATVAQ
jgi:hypothetical protein